MYNPYNQNMYMQDLQNMRDRIDRQMQQISQPQNNHQAPITQNFQIASNQNTNGIKYVDTEEQVKKELVFADTLFVNKDYTLMWLKNTSGSIKTYELNEVIELDEKDRKIADLEAKLDKLVKEKENEQYVNEDANGTTSSKKSTNGKSNKSSNE